MGDIELTAELAARLDHGVPLTVVDGIEVADTDAADATMAEAKARIEVLEAERDARSEDSDTYKAAMKTYFERALAAEAHCKRLEEALRDVLAWDAEYRASMSPEVEKDPVTLACDRARLVLEASN